ncbi:GNAT family N-acetyltransferase, partial [Streptomyces sp. ZG43]
QGLARRLVDAVAAGIRDRGEIPCLHGSASNAGAIRLYEQMGFVLRRMTVFRGVRAPATVPGATRTPTTTG